MKTKHADQETILKRMASAPLAESRPVPQSRGPNTKPRVAPTPHKAKL